mgnify:CR=1 FL=1
MTHLLRQLTARPETRHSPPPIMAAETKAPPSFPKTAALQQGATAVDDVTRALPESDIYYWSGHGAPGAWTPARASQACPLSAWGSVAASPVLSWWRSDSPSQCQSWPNNMRSAPWALVCTVIWGLLA